VEYFYRWHSLAYVVVGHGDILIETVQFWIVPEVILFASCEYV
jgi:hypothetical protein